MLFSIPLFASKEKGKADDECKIEIPEMPDITECCSSPGPESEEDVKDTIKAESSCEDVIADALRVSTGDERAPKLNEKSDSPSGNSNHIQDDNIKTSPANIQISDNELLLPFPHPADDDSSPSLIIAAENGELSIPSKKKDAATEGNISLKSSMSSDNSAIASDKKLSDEKDDELVPSNVKTNEGYGGVDVKKEFNFVLDIDSLPGVSVPLKPVEYHQVTDRDEDSIHRLQRELIEKLENQSVQISLSEDERSRNSSSPGEDENTLGNELALFEGKPNHAPGYNFAPEADMNPFNPMNSFRMLASTFHGGEALVEHLCEKYAKEQQQYELEGVPNLELEPSWGGDQDAFEDLKGNNSALVASNSFGDASDYASPQNSVDMQEGLTSFDNSEASGGGSASDDNNSDTEKALVVSSHERSRFALDNLDRVAPFVWDEEREKKEVIEELEQNGKTADAAMVKAQLLLRKASKLFQARNHKAVLLQQGKNATDSSSKSVADAKEKQDAKQSIDNASLRWKSMAQDIFSASSLDSKESNASSRHSGSTMKSVSDRASIRCEVNPIVQRQSARSHSNNPFEESDTEDNIECARGIPTIDPSDKVELAREKSEQDPFVSQVSDSDSDDCYLDDSILSRKGGNRSIGESIGFESSVAPQGLQFLSDESLRGNSVQSEDPSKVENVGNVPQDTASQYSSDHAADQSKEGTPPDGTELSLNEDLPKDVDKSNAIEPSCLNSDDLVESNTGAEAVSMKGSGDSFGDATEARSSSPTRIVADQDDEKSLYSSLGLSSANGEVESLSVNEEPVTSTDSMQLAEQKRSSESEKSKPKPLTRFMRMLNRLTGKEASKDGLQKRQQSLHLEENKLQEAEQSTPKVKPISNVEFPDIMRKPDPSIGYDDTSSIKEDPSGAQGVGIAMNATDPSGVKNSRDKEKDDDESQKSNLTPALESEKIKIVQDPSGINGASSLPRVSSDPRLISRQKDVEQAALDASDPERLDFLLNLLSGGNAKLAEIRQLIGSDVLMAQLKRNEDGRLALHCICESRLPDRSHDSESRFTAHLLGDIERLQKKIKIVMSYFDAACELTDRAGDLPAHILARNLMKWETTWYDRIYESAASKSSQSTDSIDAVTKLYKAMSECMELVLSPIGRLPLLCHEPGSVGTLLPLHIAAIFTSPVDTLRDILESYPQASNKQCDVKNIPTFVPDECVPIELHDHLSTDFPKWEVEASEQTDSADLTWSKKEDCSVSRENAIRRSDLMFVYNPVQSFADEARLYRLEARIRIDVGQIIDQESMGLTEASKRAWSIFCCSGNQYTESVKRILATLPLRLVQELATTRVEDNLSILEAASKEIAAIIHARLNELSRTVVSLQCTCDEASYRSWEECQFTRLDFGGRRSMGFLTRKLFNIQEKSIPTSFVILPYELEDLGNGEVGMASPDALPAAMKFAECLMQITDPRSVLYHVDAKSTEFYGHSIYENATNSAMRERAFKKIEAFESKLIQFYKKGKGYLYLIDEERGVPRVQESDKTYPIVLRKPAPIVKSLLPLMISGMVQMRGDKALTVLAASLLDFNITRPPSHWLSTAQGVSGQLFSKEIIQNVDPEELEEIKESLFEFISNSPFHNDSSEEEDGSNGLEWATEISVLKKIFETHDEKQKYSGLVPIQGKNGVLWCDGHESDESCVDVVSGKADDATEHHDNTHKLNDSSSTTSSDEDVYLTDSENSDAQVMPKPMSFHQPEEHGSGSDPLVSNSSTAVSSDEVETRRHQMEKSTDVTDQNQGIEASMHHVEEIQTTASVKEEESINESVTSSLQISRTNSLEVESNESEFQMDTTDGTTELSRSDAAVDIVDSLESSGDSQAIMTASLVSIKTELSDVAEESQNEDGDSSVSSHDTDSAQVYSIDSSMQANASVSINDDHSHSNASQSTKTTVEPKSKEPADEAEEGKSSPSLPNEVPEVDRTIGQTTPQKSLHSVTSPGGTGSLSYDSIVSFGLGAEDDNAQFDDIIAKQFPSYDEVYDPEKDSLQVWNAEEGVWEDVKHPLDNSEILGFDKKDHALKVKLFEQAQKLASLHNRMKSAKEEGRRFEESTRERLSSQQERSVRAILQKRKLMMRLCNLEERIISTQIGYQLQGADVLEKSQHTYQPKPESPRTKTRKAKEILLQKKDKLEKARLAWIESLSETGKPILGKSHSSMSSSNPTFASKQSAFSSTNVGLSKPEQGSTTTTEPISPGEHTSFVSTSPPTLPYRHERSICEEEWETRPTISTASRIRLASSRQNGLQNRSTNESHYSYDEDLPHQTSSYETIETIDLTNVEEPPFPSHIEVPTDAEPILHQTRHRLPSVSRSETSYATEDDHSSLPHHSDARKTSDLHDFGFADLFASVVVRDPQRREQDKFVHKNEEDANVNEREAQDFYRDDGEDLLDLTNNLEDLLARAESSPAFGVALSETMSEFLHP